MPVTIRPAERADMPAMVDLLVADAADRTARDPALWRLQDDPAAAIALDLDRVLGAAEPPLRQVWFAAFAAGRLVGLAHVLRLPVPPIYAGRWGDPGLIREDSVVAADAPEGTAEALLGAAESALWASGARLLLASTLPDSRWADHLALHGYTPITLYLSKRIDGAAARTGDQAGAVRPAGTVDVDGIVALSAAHRRMLATIDPFWTPHEGADDRFGTWMAHSLTLRDRDMLVSTAEGALDGYAIAQPASRLHIPPAHAVDRTGALDDFFHRDFADRSRLEDGGDATLLLRAAEAQFAARDYACAFVVCPAAWHSKRALLEAAGYRTGLVWTIRKPDGSR